MNLDYNRKILKELSKCDREGHKPGMWMRADFNMQERRCLECNLIVATANIPAPSQPEDEP